jgi:hypothetical protein
MVFDYITFTCYFYVPNKSNKKKVKQLFEAIPYFLPEEKQNILFSIIQKHPITSYYDTRETMKDYGYIIYREYMQHENKRYLDYIDYNDKFLVFLYKDKHIQRKWVKHLIFVGAVLIIIYFLYKNK